MPSCAEAVKWLVAEKLSPSFSVITKSPHGNFTLSTALATVSASVLSSSGNLALVAMHA